MFNYKSAFIAQGYIIFQSKKVEKENVATFVMLSGKRLHEGELTLCDLTVWLLEIL